jgi:hypothetical protein
VALPNLTRDQAVERAALVTVDSYRIALDLTDGDGKPGETTFRSVTTVEFERSPAPTPTSTSPPTRSAAPRSTARHRRVRVRRIDRHPAAGWPSATS